MSEEYYDETIAPALKELRDLCEVGKMSCVFLVEYEHQHIGGTEFSHKDTCLPLQMASWAAQAGNNIDSFLITLCRYAREHGNYGSMFLHQLGVPVTREEDNNAD